MRLLFARASEAYSYVTGEKMIKLSDDQIIDLIIKKFEGKKILLYAPLIKARKGHYRELFEQLMQQGYLRTLREQHGNRLEIIETPLFPHEIKGVEKISKVSEILFRS